MQPTITEIRVDEHGDETHESWLLMRANHVSSTPGARLFDSEVAHQHYIQVTVTRCSRRRELNRSWLFGRETVLEAKMSQAQWGAFVSSFGQGTGVPATLSFLAGEGTVAQATPESQLARSHQEVRESGEQAISEIEASYAQVMQAFEAGGKKVLREALSSLGYSIKNAPANMEFAAKSLTEHVEAVVTKARADIEGMVLTAMEQGALTEPLSVPFALGSGETDEQN